MNILVKSKSLLLRHATPPQQRIQKGDLILFVKKEEIILIKQVDKGGRWINWMRHNIYYIQWYRRVWLSKENKWVSKEWLKEIV